MRISSFSVVLSFIVLMIIGAAMIPLVDVGDKPVAQNDNVIMIRTEWPNTSAKVVEEKVTSPLEGMVSAIKGVKSVSSNSFFGESEIDVTLKRNTDVASAKFEMASLIRQTYDKLPQGVWYPWIGGGYEKGQHGSGNENELLLTYQIASNMPSGMIKNYVEQKIVSPLTKIQGVNKVEVMGAPDRYIEIDYDPEALMTYGLSANDLASAIRNFMGVDNVVGDVLYNDPNGTKTVVALHLVTAEFSKSLEQMPIKKLGDKIVYLNDLASFQYKVEEPDSYFRINGMNTIYLNVYVPSGSKLIPLSSKVRNKIEEIKGSTEKVQKINSFDAAKDQRVELKKLVIQTLSSIAILLLFVWITNRSWKNLLIVAVSLVANLLISVIGYVLFHVQLNAYSLAGITVSLGLIIDATIVMADHYGYYHDRKAFLSILAALLTTIGSLLIIFFLPQETRDILIDFGWVIIINLSVSLLIALLFVPALIDQLHYIKNKNQLRFKSGILLWNRFYTRYIMLVGKHRVICCILLVLAFGIPIFALPDKLGESKTDNMVHDDTNLNWGQKLYNSTLGSDFFFRYCKEPLSKYLGGSMYLFHESLNDIENKKNDEEKKLYIHGQMPAGSSASQLNEKVIILENYLKGFKQIKEFITNINENKADIEVSFKDAYKNGPFPYQLEDEVIAKLIAIGGADWSTFGISPEGFSNSINLKERNQQIEVTGYNYDQLYRYAENICDYLKRNDRVIDLSIETPGYENQEEEFYMKYNPWAISIYNMPPEKLYDPLSQMLKDNDLGFYSDTQISSDVKLSPVLRQGLDVWHLNNAQVNAAGVPVNISEFMDINKREAKNIIPRKNQEYVLSVAFNLLGSFDYISDYMDRAITHINKQLPVGFKCKMQEGQFEEKEGQKYGLLVLIAVIIYFICSIHFESLRIPLAILLMIPVSLIGTFLTFYFTHIPFGDGGYASLVMLNGVTVNSAIYVISQYLYQKRMPQNRTRNRVKIFVSAYNHKIIPVMLTISSTIFGLIPFFFDGTDESFWFSFAIGVSGGLLFSVLAFIFVIPIFLKLKE